MGQQNKLFLLVTFFLPSISLAAPCVTGNLKTIFNPYTNKLDYVCDGSGGGGGTASLPLPPGDTNYIRVTTGSVQTAAFFVSSGSIKGPFTLNNLTNSILGTDKNGLVISTTIATVSPGGSSGQIQYNNGGSFSGAAGFSYQSNASPNVQIVSQSASTVPFVVQAATSQSGDLQDWRDNLSNVLASVGSAGGAVFPTAAMTSTLIVGFNGVPSADLEIAESSLQNKRAFEVGNQGPNPDGFGDLFEVVQASIPANNSTKIRGRNNLLFYTDTSSINGTPDLKLDTGNASFGGHINSKGSAPSVTSCGSSPSVVGTDSAGTITVGSGVTTSCTLTFASAYTNAPACVITDNSTAITGDISAISASSFTASFSASLGSGQIYYICIGRD